MLLTKQFVVDGRARRAGRALRDAGHDVTIVQWARHETGAPGTAIVDGIPVERVSFDASHRPMAAVRQWWRRGTEAAEALQRRRPFDVVHAHDLDALPIGVRLRKRHGVRLVYDAHEIFDRMIRPDHGPWVAAAARWLEVRMLRNVDRIVTVTPECRRVLDQRARGRVRIDVVRNCPERPEGAYEVPPPGPPTAAYVGILHASRLMPQLVDAFGAAGDVDLIVAGQREAAYQEVEERARRYDNVNFLGTLPNSQVVPTVARAHVALCPLDPRAPMDSVAMATKVYEAMAAGRPTLVSRSTNTADFVVRSGVGREVTHDPDAFVHAARQLIHNPRQCDEMGRRGFSLAQSKHNWQTQAKVLVDVYAELGLP